MSETLTKAIQTTYCNVARSSLSSDHSGVHAVAEAFGYSAAELSSIPADAIVALKDDAVRRERMARNALAVVRERHGVEGMLDRMEMVFRQAAGRGPLVPRTLKEIA